MTTATANFRTAGFAHGGNVESYRETRIKTLTAAVEALSIAEAVIAQDLAAMNKASFIPSGPELENGTWDYSHELDIAKKIREATDALLGITHRLDLSTPNHQSI